MAPDLQIPGALGGTRTPNLLIRSQMLYPLSYERWCLASLRHSECLVYQPDPTPRLIDSGVRDIVGRRGEQADSRTSRIPPHQDHVVIRNAGKHRQAAQVMTEDLSCPPTRRRSERSRLDSQRSKPAPYVLPYTHLP
jgi:hypothetical protein